MTVLTTVLTLIGILFLIGVCAAWVYVEAKHPQNRYDERQTMEKHKGYRFGFWVGIFGQFLCLILTLLHCNNGQADTGILSAIGIGALLLPILAYFTYCAIKDVMLARWEHPAASGCCFLVMGGAQFFAAFGDRAVSGVKLHGIVLGIGLVYMAALYFWQLLRRERA